MAADLAAEFGLPVEQQLRMTPVPGLTITAPHSVAVVDGFTIHSPQRGVLEVVVPGGCNVSLEAGGL